VNATASAAHVVHLPRFALVVISSESERKITRAGASGLRLGYTKGVPAMRIVINFFVH